MIQGKNEDPSARGSSTLRWLVLTGLFFILVVARQFGGIAPAPPVNIPSVERFDSAPLSADLAPPQPTFLQAEDSTLEISEPPQPPERTTLLPIPDLQR